jgi:hypothetical protein
VISLKSKKTVLMENVFDELFNAVFIRFLKLMQRYNLLIEIGMKNLDFFKVIFFFKRLTPIYKMSVSILSLTSISLKALLIIKIPLKTSAQSQVNQLVLIECSCRILCRIKTPVNVATVKFSN